MRADRCTLKQLEATINPPASETLPDPKYGLLRLALLVYLFTVKVVCPLPYNSPNEMLVFIMSSLVDIIKIAKHAIIISFLWLSLFIFMTLVNHIFPYILRATSRKRNMVTY